MASKEDSRVEMSQEFAQRLFHEGAAVVLLNVPPHTQVGIDMHSWSVGPKFKGIKMIPPGLHYIYYSAVSKQGDSAPPMGFFHYFDPKEVLVKTYQPHKEEFINESEEQTDRVRANLRSLDGELGPYPVDSWRKWVSLSQYIKKEHAESVLPLSGIVSSVPTMVPVDDPSKSSTVNSDARKRHKAQDHHESDHSTADELHSHDSSDLNPSFSESAQNSCEPSSPSENASLPSGSKSNGVHPKADGLPELRSLPGMDFRWYQFPKLAYKKGASPAEITAASIDSSYLLQCLVDHLDSPTHLVSELQLSFVVFLVAQSWSGWERWRTLVDVLCRAEAGLLRHPHVYHDIIGALHYQIQEVPEDLFVDIVEQNNFLAASLRTLFANVADNAEQLPTALVERARKFRAHLMSRFGWDLDPSENEDESPVVVELS